MSDTATIKRCPNCAWAFWTARNLDLPSDESWLFVSIAERADIDLRYAATLDQLSADTRIKPRTLSKHLHALAERKDCISLQRTRTGFEITLLRPTDALAKPSVRPPMPYDDVSDQEPQNLQVSEETQNLQVSEVPESQNLQVSAPASDPEAAKSATQEPQNLQFPLMKTPLKESPEEGSLRSPPARAPALARESDPLGWQEFWNAYPPHDGGYGPARLAYRQALADGATPEGLLAALRSFPFREGRWVVQAVNWLREQRWRRSTAPVLDPALVAAGVTPEMLAAMQAAPAASAERPRLAIVGGRS